MTSRRKIRATLARAAGTACSAALKRVFRRPAANFPGKAALAIDGSFVADMRMCLREGAVVVTGTNGKTTVSNLLADILERSGAKVACNRTGANLDSGVASALLEAGVADWGVLEVDELWTARVVPDLKPRVVVLLNLFRDQLDRMGEIEIVQDAIARALRSSPGSTLLYNADDPFCEAIAMRVPNDAIAYGMGEQLDVSRGQVADSRTCQRCGAALEYRWRQYGHLGAFRCPSCGFERRPASFSALNVRRNGAGCTFDVRIEDGSVHVESPFGQAYMLYNVLAAVAAGELCDASREAFQDAIDAFDPQNGRLQVFQVEGARVLLNLAKNPTGLNQCIAMLAGEGGQPGGPDGAAAGRPEQARCAHPRAVAFFVNDREADGHDISWLWDADFQELSRVENLRAYAGGTRGIDVQVRLKHAGVEAELVSSTDDFLLRTLAWAPGAEAFAFVNYTVLPEARAALERLQREGMPLGHNEPGREPSQAPPHDVRASGRGAKLDTRRVRRLGSVRAEKLVIAHVYPSLLNLYGDGGNVTVLENRARWRGIEVDVRRIEPGDTLNLEESDIVFIGGGPDREQRIAADHLLGEAAEMRDYVEGGGVLLAICGGYQMLGKTWLLGDEPVPGLGVLDVETGRARGGSRNRLVGDIVLESPLAAMPVVGYENHAGRSYLGPGCEPFGRVIGQHGRGNNGEDGTDGARYRNAVGTYLHGPLLSKNPEVADWLLRRALERRAAKGDVLDALLEPLDDHEERAANAFMRSRLGVRQ